MFRQPKRPVHVVFLHCTASDNEDLKGAELVAEVTRWHKLRGFDTIGYHFIIDKQGLVMPGRSIENQPAAQQGFNKGSIAICVHGLAKEKFTEAALSACLNLCDDINHSYRGNLAFRGHCEVAAKSCPVFDYKALLQLNGGKMPLQLKKGSPK